MEGQGEVVMNCQGWVLFIMVQCLSRWWLPGCGQLWANAWSYILSWLEVFLHMGFLFWVFFVCFLTVSCLYAQPRLVFMHSLGQSQTLDPPFVWLPKSQNQRSHIWSSRTFFSAVFPVRRRHERASCNSGQEEMSFWGLVLPTANLWVSLQLYSPGPGFGEGSQLLKVGFVAHGNSKETPTPATFLISRF